VPDGRRVELPLELPPVSAQALPPVLLHAQAARWKAAAGWSVARPRSDLQV
jgi:hypothetical protein